MPGNDIKYDEFESNRDFFLFFSISYNKYTNMTSYHSSVSGVLVRQVRLQVI